MVELLLSLSLILGVFILGVLGLGGVFVFLKWLAKD